MPQVQVLRREPNPHEEQIANFAEGIVADKIKNETNQIARRELEMRAKASKNEQDKTRLQLFDLIQKASEATAKGEGNKGGNALLLKQVATYLYNGDFDAMFEDMGIVGDTVSNSMSDVLKNHPDVLEQVFGKLGPQAQMMQEAAGLMKGMGGQQQGVTQLPQTPDIMGGGSAGAPTNANRGAVLSGINIGPTGPTVQMQFPEAAAAETNARESAKHNIEANQIRAPYQQFIQQLDAATEEMGGLGKSAVGARVKGLGAKATSQVARMPQVQALIQLRDSMSLALGSYVNRGRPTEPDKVAAEKILPDITYPAATNDALKRFIAALLEMPLSGNEEIDAASLRAQRRAGVNSIVVPAEKIMTEGKKRGLTDDQINQAVQEYYKRKGIQ